jgi:Tol biopolymer transport system component
MNGSTDREFVDWLRDGPETGPREGLQRALAATRRVGQRPGWAIPERWIPMQLTMSRTPSGRPLLLLATVALLIALLAAAVLLAGTQQRLPDPFGLARNGAVAYAVDGDILVRDDPGLAPRVLIGGPTFESSPAFSRQGDRLAYTRQGPDGWDLVVARIDGTDAHAAWNGGDRMVFQGGSWSPDGQRILLGYAEQAIPKLAIVMADGSGIRTIEGTGPADLASWRPDGRQMVFRSQPGDGTQASAVYLADADGSNIRRLDLIGSTTSVDDFAGLQWSPDGTRLMYMTQSVGIDDLGWQIHIVDVDADGRVLDHPMRFVPGSTDEQLATWSPDGSRISFILVADGQRQIAVTEATDGAPVMRVGPTIPPAMGGLGHDWSPDGRTLLVSVFPRSGEFVTWSVDVATKAVTELEGVVIDLPSWQRLAP